ncbi:hypothetical protein OHR01_002669 [Salmonella enterica]|nr:hypothetical protein [Salmonella enterica]EKG3676701.1 hypothetical protein [Salmonella enterica]
MKKFTIPFYCTLILFSAYTCAMTPDNTAATIRNNAQATMSHHPSVSTDIKPYTLKLDNNRVIIPAGRTLMMPPDEAKNIITHMVNYNGIQEAGNIIISGDMFILE